MLIVSGRLYLKLGTREPFLASCEASMRLARQTAGCLDFAVSADPLEPDRVNVYEAWTDAESLASFRAANGDGALFSLIERFEVERHEVARSGPA